MLIHFDADLASEAHARPNYRPPPMTETLAKKLIWGALSGRGAVPIGKTRRPMSPFKGTSFAYWTGAVTAPC